VTVSWLFTVLLIVISGVTFVYTGYLLRRVLTAEPLSVPATGPSGPSEVS